MSVPSPSLELLQRAADGEIRAQNEIFDAWLPVVLGWCLRLGGPKVDAEDAAHDVFMVVLKRLDSLEQPDRFSAWVFGITRRVLRKHRTRAWARRWTGSEEVPDVADPAGDVGLRYEASEATRRVQEVLTSMPEKFREVLILCDLEERTNPEAAEILGIPTGTVASRLRVGREKFEVLARRQALHEWVERDGAVR